MFLVYGGLEDDLVVNGYTYASFQSDKDVFQSQSGYVFCLNGGAVSWKSSKQSIVADSTTEAEYIATFDAAKEAIWIKKFITDLKWFLALQILLMFIVTIMVLLHKQRNLDHISDPNTFLGVIISFEKSLREVTLRYAEFQQMIMLVIH